MRLSLVIAPWALLLLFYFLRRFGKQGEMVGQISGVVLAAVAVLRYEQLNDWGVRLLGVGADQWVPGRSDSAGVRWPYRPSLAASSQQIPPDPGSHGVGLIVVAMGLSRPSADACARASR